MLKSYGKIDDYSAVGNIERNEEDTKEEYDTKYSDEERKQVEAQEAEKLSEMQRQLQESAQKGQEIAKGNNSAENDRLARGKQREQEAMEELNRAIAQARIQAQQVSTPSMQAEVTAQTGDAKERLKFRKRRPMMNRMRSSRRSRLLPTTSTPCVTMTRKLDLSRLS